MVYATNEAIKKNRSLIDGRWDKNDTKDSANVADLVAQGKCHYYDLPELRLRELRSLLSFRKRLKKQVHSCRVRIRNNLVAQYFPELDRFWNNVRGGEPRPSCVGFSTRDAAGSDECSTSSSRYVSSRTRWICTGSGATARAAGKRRLKCMA